MDIKQFQRAAGISDVLAARWFPHITAAMKEFGIEQPLHQAMFIAQVGHESGGFTRLQENFNYSVTGLAGFVRSGRLTQSQANALVSHRYRWSVSVQSPTWCTANAWGITARLTAGSTAGAGLFRSPG